MPRLVSMLGVAEWLCRKVSPRALRPDAELISAIGQLVIFTLGRRRGSVGRGVEDEPLLGSDAMVELVEQHGHVRCLANRLRTEDRDVARVERDGRVGQVAMAPGTEPQVRRLATVGTGERVGQDHPVEMTADSPAAVAAGRPTEGSVMPSRLVRRAAGR